MTKSLNMNNYYPLIDIFKFICALLVVMIHCLEIPYGHPIATAIVKLFSSQAVPFFFIVSGFFIGNKLVSSDWDLSVVRKPLKSWLYLYLAWTVIWGYYNINMYVTKYPDASVLYILVLLFRRIVMAGQGVYWYLLILIESVALLAVFIKFKKEKLFYYIAIAGMLLSFAYDMNFTLYGLDKINSIFYTLFSWSNNVIMKGIPYVAIGFFISVNKNVFSKAKFKPILLLYLLVNITMICIYGENENLLYAFYPLQAVCLFLIAFLKQDIAINTKVNKVCRNMSMVLYYVHTIILYWIIDPLLGKDVAILLKFIIVFIMTYSLYWITMKSDFKFSKKILGIK